jgi:hypothetical protein
VGAHRVAVAQDLGPVAERLRQEGFDVQPWARGEPLPQGVDAVVVTGLEQNLMGQVDMHPNVPVVRAQGKTPEEVAWEVASRTGRPR